MKRRGADLAGLPPCLPGARLTGSEGDICSGKTKVKIGPPAVVSKASEVTLGVAVVVAQVIYRLVR
jgi:hypothetical protein